MASMQRPSRAVAALLFAVACSSASGVRIKADRNPAADFSRYGRYAWASAPLGGGEWPARSDRTAFDWKVRSLVDEELARRGYGRGAPEQADVLVDYRVTTQEREVATRSPTTHAIDLRVAALAWARRTWRATRRGRSSWR